MPSEKTERLWLITGELEQADLPENVTAAPIEPEVSDFIFAFLRLVHNFRAYGPAISQSSLTTLTVDRFLDHKSARPVYRGTGGGRGGGEAARIKISTLAEQYSDLQKRGPEFVGLCPFHKEKTPSFTVNDDKGVFHCFGCGVSGDLIGFAMQIWKLPFPEACGRLALWARGREAA